MKFSTAFLILFALVALAQEPTEVACTSTGQYLDASNELVSLEFIYSSVGTAMEQDNRMVLLLRELGYQEGTHALYQFEQYALAVFIGVDERGTATEYVLSLSPTSDSQWLLCGFVMKPQVRELQS
jgi:hypothetical protein